jgi:hypothetical protein
MFLKQWHLLSLKQESLTSKKITLPKEMFPVLSDLLVNQTKLFFKLTTPSSIWIKAHVTKGCMTMQLTHDEVFRQKRLPRVGQIVRNKKYGTFWRVMEEREIWQNTAKHPQSGEGGMVPAIYLAYWKVQKGVMPGIGKMVGYAYTLHDNTFASNWDVVEDR